MVIMSTTNFPFISSIHLNFKHNTLHEMVKYRCKYINSLNDEDITMKIGSITFFFLLLFILIDNLFF